MGTVVLPKNTISSQPFRWSAPDPTSCRMPLGKARIPWSWSTERGRVCMQKDLGPTTPSRPLVLAPIGHRETNPAEDGNVGRLVLSNGPIIRGQQPAQSMCLAHGPWRAKRLANYQVPSQREEF